MLVKLVEEEHWPEPRTPDCFSEARPKAWGKALGTVDHSENSIHAGEAAPDLGSVFEHGCDEVHEARRELPVTGRLKAQWER